MKCPKCNLDLIKNDEQGACLVAHEDKRVWQSNGKLHDHAIPCDYGGGVQYKCKNGHMVAIPTINKCWCGHVEKANDGGFDKDYQRHPTATIPWQESADYWGRRLREETRYDYIDTRNMGITQEYINLDMHGKFIMDVYTSRGGVIEPIMNGAVLSNPKIQ